MMAAPTEVDEAHQVLRNTTQLDQMDHTEVMKEAGSDPSEERDPLLNGEAAMKTRVHR